VKRATRTNLAAAVLALGTLWFLLCRQLSGEWSVNEQYSYGWFVPFFAAFLFWLRWEDRGETRNAECGTGIAIGIAIAALMVLVPVRLFEVANPDWRPVDWVHTAAVVALTLTVIWFGGGMKWVRHFAFPVCFIFVAVPWITPIEEPIVQGLMRTVAALATETITLFGIPAQLEGNLIRVSTGLVGVNEACSGVRSLQTSLMIGLLFGELKRLSVAKRCLLVIGALAIALVANFGRALFLVWIAATKEVAAVERWHDVAGYTIVAVVFIGSLALAAFLKRDGKVGSRNYEVGNEEDRPARNASQSDAGGKPEVRDRKSEVSQEHPPSSAFLLPTSYFLVSLAFLLLIEIGVEGWYRRHERGLIARERWTARWPETAKDFREINLDERTRRVLRFDEGRGATWRIPEVGAQKTQAGTENAALLYFFRWRSGKNSALLANLHRPDVCLPASGWVQMGDYGIRSYKIAENFSLPFRHFLFAQSGSAGRQRFAHAFFCLREDRVGNDNDASLGREEFAQEPSEWSRRERLNLVAQGRRHLGQQVMEYVILSSRDVRPEDAEAQFAASLPGMVEAK
jgi:exosortase